MHQISDNAGEMLVRLCIFGPVIYVGLLMMIDPMRIVRLLKDFTAEIDRFKGFLRGSQWSQPIAEPDSFKDSSGNRTFIRVIGLALTVFGLLHIAGLVN